jgi:hypothetical protein
MKRTCASRLEALGIGDVHAHGLSAQARHVVGAREDADLALVEQIEAERRR